MGRTRKRRRKGDIGAYMFIFWLMIIISFIQMIFGFIMNHLTVIIIGICLLIVIVIYTRKWEEKKQERIRQEFKEKYGYDKELFDLMNLVNELLRYQKHTLTPQQKNIKKAKMEQYRRLLNELGQGYVYFVQEQSGKTVKIGKALDPYERIVKGFGVKFPYSLEVLYLIRSDQDLKLEGAFHRHFKPKRINGEWFHLNEEDIAWIKSRDYDLEMLQLMKND